MHFIAKTHHIIKLLFTISLGLFLGSCASNPIEEAYPEGVRVMDTSHVNLKQFTGYVRTRNKVIDQITLERVYNAYIKECPIEGVNLELAISQMIHETNFLLFTGTVQPQQNNFAGLGTVNTATPGDVFPNIETGVRAHVQHLKAYGSTENCKQTIVDLRFSGIKRGSAKTLAELQGKWAFDPEYSKKILGHLNRFRMWARF